MCRERERDVRLTSMTSNNNKKSYFISRRNPLT